MPWAQFVHLAHAVQHLTLKVNKDEKKNISIERTGSIGRHGRTYLFLPQHGLCIGDTVADLKFIYAACHGSGGARLAIDLYKGRVLTAVHGKIDLIG